MSIYNAWMNALLSNINPNLSIITIEDPCELQLNNPNVKRWVCKPLNTECEVRSRKYYDLARDKSTRFKGPITTIHTEYPEKVINKLVNIYLDKIMDLAMPLQRMANRSRKW